MTIETDYLVVGAGATGLAFADALVAETSADVVLVDRRDGPGGHWRDAYPFVRLHQPSAFYGVASRPLGANARDDGGTNAGLDERATGAQVLEYLGSALDALLATGRVRFLGATDYVGDWATRHALARADGSTEAVEVRRRLVDARYLESAVPAATPRASPWATARASSRPTRSRASTATRA